MDHPFGVPAGTKWRDLRTPSVMSLIAANLIPLFGTIFLGWGGVVLILYWYETAVIGGYSILKLPFALRWYALLAVPFFIVHFGVFITFSGAFALGLYSIVDGLEGTRQELLQGIRGELLIFVPAVVVSHGVSFVTNFLGKKEYQVLDDVDVLMAAPYMRIFVMFGSVFLGVIVMAITRAPAALMSVFVVLKIVADTIAHLQEHAGQAPRLE